MVSISKYTITIHVQSLPKNLSSLEILGLHYVISVESHESLYPRYSLSDMGISPSQFGEDIDHLALKKSGGSDD